MKGTSYTTQEMVTSFIFSKPATASKEHYWIPLPSQLVAAAPNELQKAEIDATEELVRNATNPSSAKIAVKETETLQKMNCIPYAMRHQSIVPTLPIRKKRLASPRRTTNLGAEKGESTCPRSAPSLHHFTAPPRRYFAKLHGSFIGGVKVSDHPLCQDV